MRQVHPRAGDVRPVAGRRGARCCSTESGSGPSLRDRARSELRKVQFVFQMADTALNPRQRIDHILGRPIEFYLGLKGEEKRRRIGEPAPHGGAAGGVRRALPGRALRRPEAARQSCARARRVTGGAAVRRGHLGAGHHRRRQRDRAAQAAAQADRGVVRLHQPRSLHHCFVRGRDRRALRGPGGRAGQDRPGALAPLPPLHPAADRPRSRSCASAGWKRRWRPRRRRRASTVWSR